jgi:hypothetical protein
VTPVGCRGNSGYHVRESGTSTHAPSASIDSALASPGSVMSMASWTSMGDRLARPEVGGEVGDGVEFRERPLVGLVGFVSVGSLPF